MPRRPVYRARMGARAWTVAIAAVVTGCGARSSLDGYTQVTAADAGRVDATGPVDASDGPTAVGVGTPADSGHDATRDVSIPVTVPTPRPIAPLSTSRVTSRTPTLHWALPAGVTQTIVDLCLDRACTHPIGSPVTVTGTSYAPTSPLPSGVVFWRLRTGIATSATWELMVGARSAPVDSSWGTTLDVNGDGYGDLVMGAPGYDDVQNVYVYFGSASGLADTPTVTLTSPSAVEDFGISVASAGDVNGDGYADIVVGAPGLLIETDAGLPLPGNGLASVYVFLGSPVGPATAPALVLPDPGGGSIADFGSSVAGAGDVNGDGYGDIIVGAPARETTGTPTVYLYLGGPQGPAAAPSLSLADPNTQLYSLFGSAIAGAGDVNGDGYADIVVGAPGDVAGVVLGDAYVYLGGATGLAAAPAVTLSDFGPTYAYPWTYGYSVAGAGDVNGDGYADLLVSSIDAPDESVQVTLYLGSATGSGGLPSAVLVRAGGDSVLVEPTSVAGAGDVNGDGYADIALGVISYAQMDDRGIAYVYLGGVDGPPAMPTTTLMNPAPASGFDFGFSVAGASE